VQRQHRGVVHDGEAVGRRSPVFAVVAVSLVVSCGCGDSPTPAGPALKVDQTSAIGDLERVPDSPLWGISHLEVAAGDHYLALFGGYERGPGGNPEAFSDRVMVFSLEDRRWDSLELPRRLARPAALWAGDDLLVAGAQCDEPLPDDDSDAVCANAPTVVQRYDVESQKWDDVSDGLHVSDEAIGAPTSTKAVGVTADGAVFSFGGMKREHHAYSPSTGAWDTLASPPPDTSSLCVVDEALYAIGVPDLFGGDDDTAPPDIRIYALEPGGGDWTLTTTHDPATTGQMGNKVICGANELAIVPMQPLPETEISGVLWFTATGMLEEVPPVPATFPGATIADLGAAHLLLPSGPVAGAYSFADGTWTDTGLEVAATTAYRTDSGLVLVAPSEFYEPEISLLRPH
jgi:hypothetical protein